MNFSGDDHMPQIVKWNKTLYCRPKESKYLQDFFSKELLKLDFVTNNIQLNGLMADHFNYLSQQVLYLN